MFAGGSNLVIADALTDLTAVRLANDGITIDGNVLRAEAGAVWDDVVVSAIEHGLGGLECLSGIPGSAGATPVQNVGAYGAEVSDTITRVRLLDRDSGEVRWVPAGELRFGYRTSVLKEHPERRSTGHCGRRASIPAGPGSRVRAGCFGAQRAVALRRADGRAGRDQRRARRPQAVRTAVLALRARKGMVLDAADHDTWSVGSFFTNPVVAPDVYDRLAGASTGRCRTIPAPDGVKLAAGWLVERAGFGKGYPQSSQAMKSGDRALPAVHQACACSDEPRRRDRRRRAGPGPHGPRRGPGCVWHHT